MVRQSRFLRQGSMPPPRPSYGSDYSSNRLSRSSRAASTAPARDYRAGSSAPFRSSSVAPLRASSLAPSRASSLAPSRITSGYSMRSSSVAPSYSRTTYRASSEVPYRSTARASSVSPYTSYRTSSYVAPVRASSTIRASSLAPQTSQSFRTSYSTPTTSSYRIDTSVPTRQFGTRLGYQKVEKSVKPAIYDEYYGMTYVPSSGRDSWSAYRISDETLDDNDDLVYESAKKDHEVMKRVNKQIQQIEAMNAAPPVYAPVAPAYRRFIPERCPQILFVQRDPEVNHMNSVAYRRAPIHIPGAYRTPAPAAKVTYSTVDDGADLLQPKRKFIANEPLDFNKPAAFSNLKERLRDARASMDRNKASLAKYNSTDSEMNAINAEVQAIKNARAMRDQSLGPGLYQMSEDHRNITNLRKKIRSTVRRTKNKGIDL